MSKSELWLVHGGSNNQNKLHLWYQIIHIVAQLQTRHFSSATDFIFSKPIFRMSVFWQYVRRKNCKLCFASKLFLLLFVNFIVNLDVKQPCITPCDDEALKAPKVNLTLFSRLKSQNYNFWNKTMRNFDSQIWNWRVLARWELLSNNRTDLNIIEVSCFGS